MQRKQQEKDIIDEKERVDSQEDATLYGVLCISAKREHGQ